MTPKEKAEQLLNEYRYILMAEDTDCGNEILCTTIAKRCALIAIDLTFTALEEHQWQNRLMMDYYEEVKQELEKL